MWLTLDLVILGLIAIILYSLRTRTSIHPIGIIVTKNSGLAIDLHELAGGLIYLPHVKKLHVKSYLTACDFPEDISAVPPEGSVGILTMKAYTNFWSINAKIELAVVDSKNVVEVLELNYDGLANKLTREFTYPTRTL